MSLASLSDARRSAILAAWRKRILADHPGGTPGFLGERGDRFQGPAGEILVGGTKETLDRFLDGADREALSSALEEIIRLRAVQDFTPARALAFVFTLKDVIREEAGGDLRPKDLAVLERRGDELGLLAFDLYVACREKVLELRAKMMRDRSYLLMQRAGMLWEKSGGEEEATGPDCAKRGSGR